MTNMENIVRPFARLSVAPGGQSTQFSELAPPGDNDVILKVGHTDGIVKTFQGAEQATVSFYMDHKQNEIGNENLDKMQDHRKKNDHSPARLMVITRVRNTDNPVQYQDEVITVATLQKVNKEDTFLRWVLNTGAQRYGAPEDTSEAFIAVDHEDVKAELDAFNEAHKEEVVNKMVILRVRNPADKTQYVDEAKTVGYRIKRYQGADIERELPYEKFQLVKPEDRSDVFEVENEADLQAQGDIFRASHPN